MKKGSANSGDAPLSLGDISPHCGESPSNSFPKTFSVKFCPYKALIHKVRIHSLLGAPYTGKINIKSLWKGVRGDSPWDGEMSEGQRGRVPVRENLSSERFSPIKSINFYISTLVTHTGAEILLFILLFDLTVFADFHNVFRLLIFGLYKSLVDILNQFYYLDDGVIDNA